VIIEDEVTAFGQYVGNHKANDTALHPGKTQILNDNGNLRLCMNEFPLCGLHSTFKLW
jgi:hypothetical protein